MTGKELTVRLTFAMLLTAFVLLLLMLAGGSEEAQAYLIAPPVDFVADGLFAEWHNTQVSLAW